MLFRTYTAKKITARKITSLFASVAMLIGTGIFLLQPTAAHAWGNTYTGSCQNPVGSPSVSYDSGSHWIVGNGQLQWGSDAVYNNGNNMYRQCYCPLTQNNQPTSYMGTQTDWVPAYSVSAAQKQSMLNSGWIDVRDGSVFGLPAIEYLAYNSQFTCSQSGYGVGNQNQTSVYQNNQAYINNQVYSSSNTRGNVANLNTGGATYIQTGNASSNTSIYTSTNSNVASTILHPPYTPPAHTLLQGFSMQYGPYSNMTIQGNGHVESVR